MAPQPDDDALVERLLVLRAQVGSQDAFTGLFRRYDARLLFYLRRLVDSRADAEDVRQEVWMTVVRKLVTLEDPAAFRTWLYRVARHRAISWLRRRRPEVSFDEIAGFDEPAVELESDEEAGFGAEEAAAVNAALDSLPAGPREILSLRFLGGLSYAEIAAVLDRPVGTVRSRLHPAKAALRAALADLARPAAARN